MDFFLKYFNKISPQKFFLFFATLAGLLMLCLTPPFQVPDEPNHFYRAWQVSEGGFISEKQDQRVGGFLPASIEKLPAVFFYMPWSKKEKMQKVPMGDLFKQPLNPQERKFMDFNNTAMYSPVCYLPSGFAIFMFRIFEAPPLYAFYGARLCTLLFWILAVYYAIRIVPVYKWFFSFLALLPMSLFINMSINADAVTNAVCFLFIAAVLHWAFGKNSFDARDTVFALLLVFFLTSVKAAYVPLLLLFLIVPKTKFKSTKDQLLKISVLFLSGAVFFIAWNATLNSLYLPYENYHPDFRNSAALVDGADMPKQIGYILHHGTYLLCVMLDSLKASFDMYFNGYIGMFGWLENSLPPWFITSAYLLIVFLALAGGEKNIFVSWWQRLLIALTFCIIFFLVFLSQHLIWDRVGAGVILNIQGRYLIPFAPLLFILLYNRFIAAKKTTAAVTMTSVIFGLAYSVWIIYSRYY